MESQGGRQRHGPTQQSPYGRFMGMSPAVASSNVRLPLQAQTTGIPHQGAAAPLGPACSPLQPRNLLADIDQTQHDEDSDGSDDSETFDTLTPSVDYESWSADQVRKECTRRGLKLKASMKKGERIDVLRRQDVARATYDGILLGDEGESASTNAVTKWTKHCWYRLLNILFSDEFSTRFSQSGDMASRAELDSKSVNDRSRFWQEVRAAFVQQYPRTHERNLLIFEDDMFAGADPSVTRSHSASKLLKMSKEVIKNYFIAEQKFTTSGQNEDEFWKFVDKRGAVLYMRKWLTLKPDLINFVKGGFLSEDEVDTLDASTLLRDLATMAEKTPSKQKQHKSNEHVEKMASAVIRYSPYLATFDANWETLIGPSLTLQEKLQKG